MLGLAVALPAVMVAAAIADAIFGCVLTVIAEVGLIGFT